MSLNLESSSSTVSAKVVQVIVTEGRAGRGVDGDPVRAVTDLWTMEGSHIARVDAWRDEEVEKLVRRNDFAKLVQRIVGDNP